MNRTVIILILTIILAAGIIFTGYRSSAQKQKTAEMNMVYASRAVNTAQQPEEVEEWIKFRQESQLKIKNHENRIAEIRLEIENNEEIFDSAFRKKIAFLIEKIRFIKARLESYEKSPGNWKSFRYGINRDLDLIEKQFLEITADTKKYYDNSIQYRQ